MSIRDGAIRIAVDAANGVLGETRGRRLQDAVRHFRHVLSAMPDQTLGPVSADDVARLQQLGDAVIEHVESCVSDADIDDARRLVDAVYQIRALLERTARFRLWPMISTRSA